MAKAEARKKAHPMQKSVPAQISTEREVAPTMSSPATTLVDDDSASKLDEVFSLSDHKGLLRNRLRRARADGQLNIAALGLEQIPDKVMHMYDFDVNEGSSWAESVDLLKLIAADNKLEIIRSDAFPDVSAADLAYDESASNQFGGLEYLDLRRNILLEIPVGIRRLERLHLLNLSGNKLDMSVLDVICQLDGLVDLFLGNNNLIGSLPPEICRLNCLQTLDLSSNKLEDLPESIWTMSNLKHLNVADNLIRELPFEQLVDLPLIDIDASKNRLAGCLFGDNVTSMQTLQSLDVSFNLLDMLSSHAITMPALLSLAVDGNRLTSLPDVSTWSTLHIFTAAENLLSNLPIGFTELASLKNASFASNKITQIDERVGFMDALTNFTIGGNPLQIRKFITATTDDIKQDLRNRCGPAIIAEDVEQGTLTDIRSTLLRKKQSDPAIESAVISASNGKLDLKNRSLSSLDHTWIDFSNPIVMLDVSHNALPAFPLDLLSHPSITHTLKHLDLSHNYNVQDLAEALDLPNLQHLSLSKTGMTHFSFLTRYMTAPQLTVLDVSINRISGPLPALRTSFPGLTELYASENRLTTLPYDSISGLRILDVRNNEVEALPPSLGLLAPHKPGEQGLQKLEAVGNVFRVPRRDVLDKGSEAVLRWLRGRCTEKEIELQGNGWKVDDLD